MLPDDNTVHSAMLHSTDRDGVETSFPSSHAVSDVTQPRCIQSVADICSCMHHTGGAFISFPFYVVNKYLYSVSNQFSAVSKVWYVVSGAFWTRFKVAVASEIVDGEYPNDQCDGAHQIVVTTIIIIIH